MDYRFSEDLRTIREILGMTQSEIAKELGVQQVTLSRSESEITKPSDTLLEKVYGYAYERNIMLNRLKSMYWEDNKGLCKILLFHGVNYSQDFSSVLDFSTPSIELLEFDPTGLIYKEYDLSLEWIMSFVSDVEGNDYIIAPIADNRMYQIINSFIEGEITDQQCMHCLASTNLGKQFVFKSDKAVKQLKMLERLYVSSGERDYYKAIRLEESKASVEKVKSSRIQYRGKGRYIDEILKD